MSMSEERANQISELIGQAIELAEKNWDGRRSSQLLYFLREARLYADQMTEEPAEQANPASDQEELERLRDRVSELEGRGAQPEPIKHGPNGPGTAGQLTELDEPDRADEANDADDPDVRSEGQGSERPEQTDHTAPPAPPDVTGGAQVDAGEGSR